MARSPRVPKLPTLRARAILLWERAYPALLPAALVLGGYAALALSGVLEIAPWWARLVLLVLTLGAAGALARRGVVRIEGPSRTAALARIEADSRLSSGSLRALEDEPLYGDGNDAYWRVHQDRLRRAARRARLDRPRASADRADPWGLRFVIGLLIAAGLVIAGDQRGDRLRTAFLPGLMPSGPVIADVWLDPPAYTGRPPVLLVQSGPLPDGVAGQVTVPEGTTLRLRLSGTSARPPRARVSLATREGSRRVRPERGEGGATAEITLDRNAALSIRAGGKNAAWPIVVTPDEAPRIRLTGEPDQEGGRRLSLPLETEDDYGIADAAAVLTLSDEQPLSPDAPRPDAQVMAREEALPIPALEGGTGERLIEIDLTEHPWAGLIVNLSVRVTDGAGQTAATVPRTVRLPERSFYDPLARTVIEERRKLAIAPSSWARTARLLDALTLAPERTAESTREYLLLRTAYHDVFGGRGEETEAVVESFWPLAIELEDEGLALARARLDEAQAALRQALADGASTEEIERLIEELREAMNDYVQALAQSGDAFSNEPSEQIAGQDLDDMLDAMRDAAERGAEEEARDLLSQLERMLENLSITQGGEGEGQEGEGQQGQGEGQAGQGQPGRAGQGGGQPGGALGQADSLIGEQRGLSDETFSARRGERGSGGLAGEQRSLREALEELRGEELRGRGGEREGDAGRQADQAFDRAGDAMDGAARALERGDLGTAQALQELALEGLTEGARSLAEARQDGEEGTDEGQGQDRAEGPGSVAGRDPLGRPYGPQGDTGVEIPDLSDPERIREVIQTLRERVSDPDLPAEERRYLERLLERF